MRVMYEFLDMFFFSSRRRHTRYWRDWSSDVCSSDLWISSIDLENAAIAHPAVQEAAIIGVFHPKWQERPLLVAVRRPGPDRKRGGEGKSGDSGGRRII